MGQYFFYDGHGNKVPIKPGAGGQTPFIGENGNWWVGATDTGVQAQGKDGLTPHIGENGNWWIGDTDIGVQAQGANGTSVTIESIIESTEDGGSNVVEFSNGKTVTIKNGKNGTNGKTAYEYAKEGGYTGTAEEFAIKLAKENGVGQKTAGKEYIVDGETVLADHGAEIFNEYYGDLANEAVGEFSHAQGSWTKAHGPFSHAQGFATRAKGECAHAQGYGGYAEGNYSHVEGVGGAAIGLGSHVEGGYTIARGRYQHVQGKSNIEDTESKYAHIVGNGTGESSRSNAHTVDWDGNGWFAGKIKLGGTGQDDENAVEVATKPELKALSEEIADLTLGIASDGLVYLFVNGKPVGTGIPQGASGDVFGYVDENNTIVLNGNLADGTYSIKYEMEDGSTVDVGDLVLSDEEDTTGHTNLADPTSADWQEGYRLSISSGGTSALAGHTTTNYIPCKAGDVLRVKGLTITSQSGIDQSASAKIVLYDASKAKVSGSPGLPTSGSGNHYGAMVTVDGDVSTYTVLTCNDGMQYAPSTTAYIRIDGFLMDGYTKNDVIITVNEEIV